MMNMAGKKQKNIKQFWIRVICVVLAVLLAGSSLMALFGIF